MSEYERDSSDQDLEGLGQRREGGFGQDQERGEQGGFGQDQERGGQGQGAVMGDAERTLSRQGVLGDDDGPKEEHEDGGLLGTVEHLLGGQQDR